MFFLGLIVGFLVCSLMVVNMLKCHNLFNEDSSLVDLSEGEAVSQAVARDHQGGLMPETPLPNLYIFNCPVHGLEYTVYCFRASDPNHLDRWYVSPLVVNKPTNSDLKEIKLQRGIHERE